MKRISVIRIIYLKLGNETATVVKVSDVIDVNDDFYRSIFSKQAHVDGPVLARTNNMVIRKPTATYNSAYFFYIIFDETHPLYNLSLLLSQTYDGPALNNIQWMTAGDNYILTSYSATSSAIDSFVRSYTDIDKAIDRV